MSGHDFAGLGVHEAARIGAAASANEVLVSATTVAAAGDPPAGPAVAVELKGLAAPIELCPVLWNHATSD